MQIRRLVIERFRGIEHLELHPGPRTVLIGPNNAGKSTVLEALDILLDPGHGRARRAPTELDYFKRDTDHEYRIEAVLGKLDTAFAADAAEALEGWHAEDLRIQPEPDGDGVEPVVRVVARGTTDLDLVHEFPKQDIAGRRFPRDLRQRLGWVFDGRRRDPSHQLAFYQGSLLDQLFNGLDIASAVSELRAALGQGAEQVNQDLVVAGELAAIDADLTGLGLQSAGPSAFEAGALSERELLQALRLTMAGKDGTLVPLLRQGRGTQRLTVLAILLRVARTKRGPSLIGGFEEPEEALEPVRQVQAAQLIAEIANEGGQVFVATHSPEVARAFDLGDLTLLKGRPRVEATALATALTGAARNVLERKMDGPTVRGLFAPVPMVVEGPTDVAVVTIFWEKLASDGSVPTVAQHQLDLVDAGGHGPMPMIVQLLSEAGKAPAALLEGDADSSQRILDDGHCRCSIVYPRDEARNNLEKMLVSSYTATALATAMKVVATDRSHDWPEQHVELKNRASNVGASEAEKAALDRATDITSALDALEAATMRAAVYACLTGGGRAPFEIKNRRSARLFAESLVTSGGVAEPFRTALVNLSVWIQAEEPRPDERLDLVP